MKRTRWTTEAKLSEFPPVVCRLLARPRARGQAVNRPLTDSEVAAAAGMSEAEVAAYSLAMSWDMISVRVMLAFTKACDVDLDNQTSLMRHLKYLRRGPKWIHLKNDQQWKTRWLPMIQAYARHLRETRSQTRG
jgi:hypothetical protein